MTLSLMAFSLKWLSSCSPELFDDPVVELSNLIIKQFFETGKKGQIYYCGKKRKKLRRQ